MPRVTVNSQSIGPIDVGPNDPLTVVRQPGSATKYGQYRVPWQFYTAARFYGEINLPILQFTPNPTSYSMTLPMRGTENNIMGGKSLAFWVNPVTGKYFDAYNLQFSFQTGSILPSNKDSTIDSGLPHGVSSHYQILAMVNEDKVRDNEGTPNYYHLISNTPLYPDLHCVGMVRPEDISWTETCDNPFSLEYTVNMLVFYTDPDLTDPAACAEAWRRIELTSRINLLTATETSRFEQAGPSSFFA